MTASKKFIGVICILFTLIFPGKSYTQSISVGSLLDEQMQLHSLLSDTLTPALISRPAPLQRYQRLVGGGEESAWWNRDFTDNALYSNLGVDVGVMPFQIQQTFNSNIPYGDNNGAAWYGRGSNVEFNGGFYIRSEYLLININPHIIYQENVDFLRPRFIPGDGDGGVRYIAEGIGAVLDTPFRFGPDPFTTIDPGNSSIRLRYKKLETGVSTEPLWWGPAIQYPLVFSNNAPGIPHFFLSSREPFRIPYFGNVQFSWIMGYPQESEYFDGNGEGETRFMTAANLSYTPPFFQNLTIGLTRTYHLYQDNGFDFSNIFLLFQPGATQDFVSSGQGVDTSTDKNQIISLYAHIQLPEANAEIYGEFLRDDRSYNTRDFVNQPHHNSGYTFGFQKLSYLPWIDFLKTNLEFTNLTTSQINQVRPQTYIYTHSKVTQGHTNRGQILGAAIGPGSNSQFLSFDAYKGDFKVGVFAQRWVDNNNFHFERGSRTISPSRDFGDYFRHRVNLNFGTKFLYGPGPLYFNGQLIWTKAFNYGRFDYGEFSGVTIRNYEHRDLINIQFQLGLTYIF